MYTPRMSAQLNSASLHRKPENLLGDVSSTVARRKLIFLVELPAGTDGHARQKCISAALVARELYKALPFTIFLVLEARHRRIIS